MIFLFVVTIVARPIYVFQSQQESDSQAVATLECNTQFQPVYAIRFNPQKFAHFCRPSELPSLTLDRARLPQPMHWVPSKYGH
jgi:hypothetical protein